MLSYIKKFLNTNLSFLIILIVVVFSLYGKAINFELTSLDDTTLIKDNISYISNINNVPKLFIKSCFYSNDHYYYRPILTLSFAVETILFGYNLKVYHLTNILLFIILLYLSYIFFTYYLKTDKNVTKLIILLFSVHPVFSLVYVWIPARNDSLFAISVILSLIALLNILKTNKFKYIIFFSSFFCFSLFLKESGIILPIAYGAFIWFFDYKITKKQIFITLLLLLPFIIIYVLLRKYSIPKTYIELNLINIKTILTNIINVILMYIEKLLYPNYIPVLVSKVNLTIITIITNIVFVLFFIIVYLKNILNRKIVIFSLFWFLLLLLPTFFVLDNQILFHRLLTPIIFLIYMLIIFVEHILNKYKRLSKYLIVIFIFIFTTLYYASFFQQNKYKNEKNFIINSYLDSPYSLVTCNSMVMLYLKTGNIDKATELMNYILQKKFTYGYLLNYATLLCASGKFDKAEEICLKIEKDLKGRKVRKEMIYITLSEIYYMKKNYEKAYAYIQKAYKLKPYDTNLLKQFAKIAEKIGNIEQALGIYKNLLKIDRNNEEYKNKIYLLDKEPIKN